MYTRLPLPMIALHSFTHNHNVLLLCFTLSILSYHSPSLDYCLLLTLIMYSCVFSARSVRRGDFRGCTSGARTCRTAPTTPGTGTGSTTVPETTKQRECQRRRTGCAWVQSRRSTRTTKGEKCSTFDTQYMQYYFLVNTFLLHNYSTEINEFNSSQWIW